MNANFFNGAALAPDWEMVGPEPVINVSAIDLRTKINSVGSPMPLLPQASLTVLPLTVMEVTPLAPIPRIPKYVTQMSFMSYPPEEKTGQAQQSLDDNFFLSVSSFDIKNCEYSSSRLEVALK